MNREGAGEACDSPAGFVVSQLKILFCHPDKQNAQMKWERSLRRVTTPAAQMNTFLSKPNTKPNRIQSTKHKTGLAGHKAAQPSSAPLIPRFDVGALSVSLVFGMGWEQCCVLIGSFQLEKPSQTPSPPHCTHPHISQCHIPAVPEHLQVPPLPGQAVLVHHLLCWRRNCC